MTIQENFFLTSWWCYYCQVRHQLLSVVIRIQAFCEVSMSTDRIPPFPKERRLKDFKITVSGFCHTFHQCNIFKHILYFIWRFRNIKNLSNGIFILFLRGLKNTSNLNFRVQRRFAVIIEVDHLRHILNSRFEGAIVHQIIELWDLTNVVLYIILFAL